MKFDDTGLKLRWESESESDSACRTDEMFWYIHLVLLECLVIINDQTKGYVAVGVPEADASKSKRNCQSLPI